MKGTESQPQLPPPHLRYRQSLGPPTDMSERRTSPRVFLQTEVNLESQNNFFAGFTEDISEGGLFIATYDLQSRGTEVEVEFTLPDGYSVRTVGVVRWIRDPREQQEGVPPGMGIQFQQLTVEDQQAINNFLSARAPIFYDE